MKSLKKDSFLLVFFRIFSYFSHINLKIILKYVIICLVNNYLVNNKGG